MGFDVEIIGQIALITILIGAVAIFFLVPFLPRLPFMPGHMVEINGVMGIVDAISTFHTTIRKFDGTMVFLPNALVMASRISNFNDTPSRRIELNLSIRPESDLEYANQLIVKLMAEDERVLDEPAPPVAFVMDADASSIDMSAYCWVQNGDWLSARSDILLRTSAALRQEPRIQLALSEQKVYLSREEETAD
jgi:small conductance mechanosensitive channel